MKKKIPLFSLLAAVFAVGFLVSGFMVYKTLRDAHTESQGFEKLARMVEEEGPKGTLPPTPARQPDSEETLPTETVPEQTLPETAPLSPYAPLKAQNPDFFGWLTIDDTKLNYPVMHCPEEPERYLHRDFDREDSQSGVPFLAGECTEECGNYLIYGHNMKNGTMFASITGYANKSYWEEHPLIRFDTLTDSGEYEIVGAFYSRVYERDAKNVFRYYAYTDLSQRERFQEYLEQVKASALYDTGVETVYGDQLITLSTCSYHTDEGRFVVVARKTGE